MHAYGSVYGISGRIVAEIIARNYENLRLLANEGELVIRAGLMSSVH